MTYHHIVLFRLNDGVDDATRQLVINKLQELGVGHPGLKSWQVHQSLDIRKGLILIEEAVFEERQDFETFQRSTVHAQTGEFMKDVADWWVGDYEEL